MNQAYPIHVNNDISISITCINSLYFFGPSHSRKGIHICRVSRWEGNLHNGHVGGISCLVVCTNVELHKVFIRSLSKKRIKEEGWFFGRNGEIVLPRHLNDGRTKAS